MVLQVPTGSQEVYLLFSPMAVNFKSIPPINQVLCFVGGMAFGMNRR
jgi:hypothetical protein